MLEHPGKLNEDQARQIVDRFNENLAGPENANKTGILTGGTKLHALTIPPEDSQFLETRRFGVNEVARWFGLPPSRIGGDRSSGTYANLSQDQLAFLLHSARPVCRMFEQEFDRKLLSPADKGVVGTRFDLDGLLDMATVTKTEKIAATADGTQEEDEDDAE